MNVSDQVVGHFADSIARWAVDAAAAAILYLFQYIARPTDAVFTTLGPAYNRVLAMAMLLAGAMAACALMERTLGGSKGAGPEVVIRTVAACAAAMVGLSVMRYAVGYADLLATAWNADILGGARSLLNQVGPAYQVSSGQALGSALGLFLAALLTVLLAILVHIELVLRAALLVVTTSIFPLACVMAIWPRLSHTVSHMAGFLLALLLSKFVIATAVYLGFEMVVQAFMSNASGDPTGALMTGLATLTAAALSPIVLLQGVRFAEVGAAHAARGFGFAAGRGAGAAVQGASRRLISGGSWPGLRNAGRALGQRLRSKTAHPSQPRAQ